VNEDAKRVAADIAKSAHDKESGILWGMLWAYADAARICREQSAGIEYGADGETFVGEDNEEVLSCAKFIEERAA